MKHERKHVKMKYPCQKLLAHWSMIMNVISESFKKNNRTNR